MSEFTKVVINEQYGGFSLSTEGYREYLKRAGKTWTEEPSPYKTLGPNFIVEGELWYGPSELSRTDPILVSVVEDLGHIANGAYATLVVANIPTGTLYRIHEYDGYESIDVRDQMDWSQA